jgi:hypothetical protein
MPHCRLFPTLVRGQRPVSPLKWNQLKEAIKECKMKINGIFALVLPVVVGLTLAVLPGEKPVNPEVVAAYPVVTDQPALDAEWLAVQCQYNPFGAKCPKFSQSGAATQPAPDWLATRCQYEPGYENCSGQKVTQPATRPVGDWLATRCQYEPGYETGYKVCQD